MSAGARGASTAPGSLAERLTAFVRALRGHGIRIGPGETVDAAAVLEVLGLTDRERIREGLAAALLRADRQRAVFDAAFELYFPLGVGELTGARGASAGDRDELRDRLAEALAANDTAALTRLAAEAVDLLGRYGSPGSDGWSAHQTLDRLRPQTLLARILAASQGAGGEADGGFSGAGAGGGPGGGLRMGFGGGFAFGSTVGAGAG
ncbi:hypothetical protein PV367_40135, partial [Streptomyces europaeiscabiei]|nr:hypothetical protein [Streptomyces europaeiscabiei]